MATGRDVTFRLSVRAVEAACYRLQRVVDRRRHKDNGGSGSSDNSYSGGIFAADCIVKDTGVDVEVGGCVVD